MSDPRNIQASVQSWADQYRGEEYWPPLANLARPTEEVGELARAVNQQHGEKKVTSGRIEPTSRSSSEISCSS
ncbi:MAG: hypothetical protein R2849_06255 [Thermomicrobiales bacterium]